MKPRVRFTLYVLALCLAVWGCELNKGVDFMVMQETPESSAVVEGQGLTATMHLGWFDQPFLKTNVVDAMVFPAPGEAGENLRQKKWHYFSFASDRYLIGLAAVDATYLANAFVYVYDFATDAIKEFSHIGFSHVVTVSGNSVSGQTEYAAQGFRILIQNDGATHTVSFDCDDGTDTLTGTLSAVEIGDPFVQAKEVNFHHIVYTHQNSMAAASGSAFWNGEEVFGGDIAFAGMDYTVGIQNYETFWNWASGTGLAADGTPLAVNLGGDALFWIGDTIHRVEGVTFSYEDLLSDWTIRSEDGVIDLTFHPVSMRSGNIDFGIIVSRFYQPFGTFSGTIAGPDGTVYEIGTMIGVTEEHYAKW